MKSTPYGTLYYTRDNAGHVKTVRSDQSDGVAVDYGFDDDERLSTVTDQYGGTAKVTTYGYDTAGRMLGWVQPNGVTTAFTYDDVNHLKNVSIKNAAATTLASYAYTLGTAGNRTGVTEAGGRTIAWTYDTLYRLTGETISGAASANGAVGYTYDAAGNRLSRTSTLSGVPATTSTYDANDRTDADTWNANGNMLTRDGRSQSFDSLDRLMSSSPTSGGTVVKVTYDGDGNRVAQDVGGVVSSYLVDDQNPTGYGQVVEERLSGAVTKAYVFGRKALSQRAKSGSAWATTYYGMDGHGSVVLLTDGTGAVTDTWEYDAFGTVIGRTGTTANTILYSGEWMDSEQGLQYLRARWYAPGMGRFVSGDTWETPDGAYRYGGNNPVMGVDPSGHFTLTEQMATVAIIGIMAVNATTHAVAWYKARSEWYHCTNPEACTWRYINDARAKYRNTPIAPHDLEGLSDVETRELQRIEDANAVRTALWDVRRGSGQYDLDLANAEHYASAYVFGLIGGWKGLGGFVFMTGAAVGKFAVQGNWFWFAASSGVRIPPAISRILHRPTDEGGPPSPYPWMDQYWVSRGYLDGQLEPPVDR